MLSCCFACPVSFLFLLSLVYFAQKHVCWLSRRGRLGLFLLQPSCCWKPLLSPFISVNVTTRTGIYSYSPVDSLYNPDVFWGILFLQNLPTDNSADSQAKCHDNPNLTGRKYAVFVYQGLFISLFFVFFINNNSVWIYLCICFIQGLLE